jgi:hypothetical protein
MKDTLRWGAVNSMPEEEERISWVVAVAIYDEVVGLHGRRRVGVIVCGRVEVIVYGRVEVIVHERLEAIV